MIVVVIIVERELITVYKPIAACGQYCKSMICLDNLPLAIEPATLPKLRCKQNWLVQKSTNLQLHFIQQQFVWIESKVVLLSIATNYLTMNMIGLLQCVYSMLVIEPTLFREYNQIALTLVPPCILTRISLYLDQNSDQVHD